jgi:hypothetical protein
MLPPVNFSFVMNQMVDVQRAAAHKAVNLKKCFSSGIMIGVLNS